MKHADVIVSYIGKISQDTSQDKHAVLKTMQYKNITNINTNINLSVFPI